MAEQRKQKTEYRSQKAENRRQKTEGRRQSTGCLTAKTEIYSLSSVLCSLAVVVFAVMTAGCAVSEKNPPSTCVAEASADRQHVLIDSNNVTPASDNPAGPPAEEDFELLEEELAEEDFELLEEELDEQAVEVDDPLEPLNRLMFGVNDTLYFWVAKPVIQVYKDVTPEPARIGIRNFFHNLATPVRFANCLLQGKADSAGTELNRFVINTTEGVLGFGDPARDKRGLEPAEEDLGQTLAIHGIDNGFYIVWPLLGPSTMRDSVGLVGDLFLDPVAYVKPYEISVAIWAGEITNEGSFHIGEYEDFKAASLEPYVAMRQAYIQYRNKKIQE
jgi:phospholipid-binding lipoprotein MlaA